MRHTTNINTRLKEAHDTLQLANKYIDALQANAEMMATQHLTNYEMDILINELFPIAGDASQTVKNHAYERRELFNKALNADDLQNFRGTKWQFINAAADMADHAAPIRETASSKENRLKNIFAGHQLIDKAYELVMAY